MYLVRGRPHPELAGLVGGYADFAERSAEPVETREAANAKIVVIVDLDDGWTVEGERFRSFAGGLYARPVRVRHEGTAAGVQIDLEPVAARALLGVPAGELAGRTVGLEDLLGRRADRVAERLHARRRAGGAVRDPRRGAPPCTRGRARVVPARHAAGLGAAARPAAAACASRTWRRRWAARGATSSTASPPTSARRRRSPRG